MVVPAAPRSRGEGQLLKSDIRWVLGLEFDAVVIDQRIIVERNIRKILWSNAAINHDLRHSAISHLVMAGADLRSVQEIAGHSTVTMTEKYSHLAPGHAREQMAPPARNWTPIMSNTTLARWKLAFRPGI